MSDMPSVVLGVGQQALPARPCDEPGSPPKSVDLSGALGMTSAEAASLPEEFWPDHVECQVRTDGTHELYEGLGGQVIPHQ